MGESPELTGDQGYQLAERAFVPLAPGEQQHAVEIASAPWVTNAARLSDFYERNGQRVSAEGQCTPDAQKVIALVLAEIGARRFW